MIQLTPEQLEIRDYMLVEDGIVLVNAGAGCGKSFLARQLVKALKAEKVLYTAFNKAIVEEASTLFTSEEVQCKTLHALAYRYTKPSSDIRATNYRDLPEDISYESKYIILKGIEKFFVSSSTDMWHFFEDHFKEEKDYELFSRVSVDIVEKMLAKELPWSFSFMLKYFHLLLSENPELCEFDLVILDEINDTTGVALEIFKLLKAPKKLGLGEPDQAIYSFMHLVNGFDELKDVPVFPLTNSFRCSKDIARDIEHFMQIEVNKDFKFTGTDKPVTNGETLFCTLTNSAIVGDLVSRIENNQDFKLLRRPADIFACPLAVLSASAGSKIYQASYKYLEDIRNTWKTLDTAKTFFEYLQDTLEDQEVHSAVNLLMSLRKQGLNLFDIYKTVKNYKQKGDYTVATVFTSKGLEFETVYLADAFTVALHKMRLKGPVKDKKDIELCRCIYVACSRAGKNLYTDILT